jgi:hypothetical protein
MPEWLHDSFAKDDVLPTQTLALALRLAVAFALGCVVAAIYRLTHGKPGNQPAALLATLVLLTVLICMVTLVIGNSVARAFSLVGALAIVRFRTVVEDTRDTAFVIFAVGVGMAVGAGFLTIPLLGIPFAAAAAFLFRPRVGGLPPPALDFALNVRIGVGHSPDALLREAFGKHLARSRLTALATARQGAALDLTYAVRLRREDAAVALVAEVNGLEGVQNVELRQA